MANTYTKIASVTVGAGGASSIDFTSIPATFTDLVVKASVRSDKASTFADLTMKFNSSTTSYTNRLVYGDGSSAGSYLDNYANQGYITTMNGATSTSSTFTNAEVYIPNYAGSANKSFSDDGVTENNATSSYAVLNAGLWSNTAAITNIALLTPSGNFVQYSTATLYGVTNASTAATKKATGGDIITTSGGYTYHAFLTSGTFTPTQSLSCDVLVVAGGGGGGRQMSGGGGAGGLRGLTAQSLGNGIAYTVTIGAGGAGAVSGSAGVKGNNSSIAGTGLTTITSTGGGRGQSNDGTTSSGGNGGSGGGGSGSGTANRLTAGTGNEGSYSPVEGYDGGAGFNGGNYGGGGGGGATAVGSAGTTSTGGAGGAGSSAYSSWATATSTGASNAYAGGGGGGSENGGGGAGGTGGGGAGSGSTNGASGTSNTGGGGGGSQNGSFNGGSGGSGIVIVRYAV